MTDIRWRGYTLLVGKDVMEGKTGIKQPCQRIKSRKEKAARYIILMRTRARHPLGWRQQAAEQRFQTYLLAYC